MERDRLEKWLTQAERHVALGEQHIARQHDIIARLGQSGDALKTARELLAQFQNSQKLHIGERDRLRLELSRLACGTSERQPVGTDGRQLAGLLGVLVRAAIEYADGKARAAFYLADAAETELRHVVGMPAAYARYVDGFSISTQSLACGLAAAAKQPVLTRDVFQEPRWKGWVWLADQFKYRACWSFPIVAPSGKTLGSFAMYCPNPRDATPRDIEVACLLSRTAASIISCQHPAHLPG
jgi:GAF domain-containing protein